MKTEVLFSSNSEDWETPQEFFNMLDAEFHFTLDPCASVENHKCELYFTKEQNGLQESWGGTKCSVIHHMADRLANGLKKHIWKVRSLTQPLLC